MIDKFNRYLPYNSLDPLDLAQFHMLCLESTKNHFSKDSMDHFLKNPFCKVFFSRFCLGIIQTLKAEAEIITLAVLPNHRNRGIGKKLLRDILSYLSSSEVDKVFLEVAMNNHSAITIYKGKEFSEWNGHALITSLKDKSLRKLIFDDLSNVKEEIIFKNKIGRIRDIQVHPDNGKVYFLGEDALWLMEKI